MDKIKGMTIVAMVILAVAFFYMSYRRTAQFNKEMQDINESLRQVASHLDRIATSLERAQLLKPAPTAQQPGG